MKWLLYSKNEIKINWNIKMIKKELIRKKKHNGLEMNELGWQILRRNRIQLL